MSGWSWAIVVFEPKRVCETTNCCDLVYQKEVMVIQVGIYTQKMFIIARIFKKKAKKCTLKDGLIDKIVNKIEQMLEELRPLSSSLVGDDGCIDGFVEKKGV